MDTNLSPQEMKAACELLTALDIFEIYGVKQFDTVRPYRQTYHEKTREDLRR